MKGEETNKIAEREVVEGKVTTRVMIVGTILATSLILLSAEADSTVWLFVEKGFGVLLFWIAASIDLNKKVDKTNK